MCYQTKFTTRKEENLEPLLCDCAQNQVPLFIKPHQIITLRLQPQARAPL